MNLREWIGCLVPVLIGLAINIAIIYVVAHFIIKYW
jgi:hypothetical protein